MVTQVKKPLAIFPDSPRNIKVVDKNGYITPEFQLFLDQLILALQTNFKPEGIVVPQESASDITLLTGTQSVGNILYDSTNNAFKGNINGTWKTFTLT